MSQNRQVQQTRTATKTCKTCEFLAFKDLVEMRKLHKCVLSNLPKHPDLHACSYYKERH